MSEGTSIYGMIAGIGDAFGKSYESSRKAAQEEEAPAIFGQLLGLNGGPSTAPAQGATLGTLGQVQPAPSARAVPTFVGLSGANPSADKKLNGSNADFVSAMLPHAIEASKATGVDPRIILAQSAIETGYGRSAPGNNYFGIKSHGEAGGNTMATTEVVNGAPVRVNDSFRAFPSMAASAAGYADFLNKNPRYAGLKSAQGLEAQAAALQASGYATDPHYGGKVLSIARRLPAPGGAGAAAASGQPVAFANNEAETQALEQRMGMVPTQTAEADMPAQGASPAGFVIPGQPQAPAAAPTAAPAAPQGFAGFGTGASRMSPEQAAVLQTAWKNPVTRPMATQIYGELLKGQASPWKLQQMGDQPVLFNERTAQIVPVGQGKRSTTTVGNAVVDTATGQVIYQGQDKDASKLQTVAPGNVLFDPVTRQPVFTAPNKETEPKYSMQTTQDGTLLAVNPANPADVQVIRPGQQPRPLTADERRAYGVPDGAAAGMGPDGKPFGIGGSSKTEVNVDTKGAGKFSEKANEIQAKRYGEMVDAADNAVPLRSDIDTMAEMATRLNTGRLAEARLGLAQYAREAGFESIASSLTGGKMGEMEAFTALADKLVPRMRVPGSGSTSDAEGRAFKNSLPSLLKTPGGNALIADTFKGLADYQAQVGGIAGKALRQEISQAEADQAIRELPSPYARFKEYRAAQGDAPAAGGPAAQAPKPAVAKGAERQPLPDGYSAARALAEAKASVAAGKDKTVIAERLRAYGIDPARLDR